MVAFSPHIPLTALQVKVYRYLVDQRDTTGIMPAVREVQAHCHFASQSQAVAVLRALEKKGVVQRRPGKARGLLLLPQPKRDGVNIVSVPILGTIPAGYPVDTTENVLGHIQVDARLLGSAPASTVFTVVVRGDSMVGASIEDGDHVLCQTTESRPPCPNDIVAALIDGEATLKRYLVLENTPCLKAENPKYPDLIPARELVIQGIYIGLLRGIPNIISD